jgi:hypothetical protein
MVKTVYPVTEAIAGNEGKSSSRKSVVNHKKALRVKGFFHKYE